MTMMVAMLPGIDSSDKFDDRTDHLFSMGETEASLLSYFLVLRLWQQVVGQSQLLSMHSIRNKMGFP